MDVGANVLPYLAEVSDAPHLYTLKLEANPGPK